MRIDIVIGVFLFPWMIERIIFCLQLLILGRLVINLNVTNQSQYQPSDIDPAPII